MEELIDQARELAEQGVKELILVAQETTLYGVDLYGRKRLHELLRELCRIDGIYWIRIPVPVIPRRFMRSSFR